MARKTAHDKIMELRKEFGIPEKKLSKEEQEEERLEKLEQKARSKRCDLAGTMDKYREMFHLDYWTDEWIGPGPEEIPAFTTEFMSIAEWKKLKRYRKKRWKEEYCFEVPTIHLPAEPKEPKIVKKLRKKRKKAEKKSRRQDDYDLAYWYMKKFLKPKYADEIYIKFGDDFEGMVTYACTQARFIIQLNNVREISPEEMADRLLQREKDAADGAVDCGGLIFKPVEKANAYRLHHDTDLSRNPMPDIPDEYWDEFDKWAKKHPLKKYEKRARWTMYGPIGLRRAEFLEHINKKNKKFQKAYAKQDFGLNIKTISKKEIKKIRSKNIRGFDKKRQEFSDMLDKLIAKGNMDTDTAGEIMAEADLIKEKFVMYYDQVTEALQCDDPTKNKNTIGYQMAQRDKRRRKWFDKMIKGKKDKDLPISGRAGDEKITVEKRGNLYRMDIVGPESSCTHHAETLMGLRM